MLTEILKQTAIINDFDENVVYNGAWHTDEGYPSMFYNGDDHWCSPVDGDDAKNYGYEFDFYGDSFAIIGNLEYLNGKFDVFIDGEYVTTVDAYSSGRIVYSRLYESERLELKNHHVVIKGSGTKNVASTGYNMQLDYIETYIHEKLIWQSSDDQIVTVEDGMITACKTGMADITVIAGEYSDTIHVNVKVNPATIDLSALEKIIEDAKMIDLNTYQEIGKSEFKMALENAENILIDPIDQETVDLAVNTLADAIKNLIKIGEDSEKPIEPDKLDDSNISKSPQTGDYSEGLIYGYFMIACTVIIYVCKRKENKMF